MILLTAIINNIYILPTNNSVEDCVFRNNILVIMLQNSGDITIIRNIFSNNFANSGSCIYLYQSQPNSLCVIANCSFTENNATTAGGGIYIESFGNFSIIGSFFSNNLGNPGAAFSSMSSQFNSLLQIIECSFLENNSPIYAGGVFMQTVGNVLISRSKFLNNMAQYGGAILSFNAQPGLFELNDCYFSGNNVSSSGGGIFLQAFGNAVIARNIFSNNGAMNGGAINFYNAQTGSFLQVIDSVFSENSALNEGSVFYVDTFGNTSFIKSNFSNNSAFHSTIFLVSQLTYSWVMIVNCSFLENFSQLYGGALDLEMLGNTWIISSSFSNNVALGGGAAIYLYTFLPNTLLTLEECIFVENNSPTKYSGGTISMQEFGNISIINCTFSKNFAVNGSCIYSYDQCNYILTFF